MASIAVVILNYNGEKLLQEFLPSVVQYSEGAKIYVADNSSTDNSITVLERNFPSQSWFSQYKTLYVEKKKKKERKHHK